MNIQRRVRRSNASRITRLCRTLWQNARGLGLAALLSGLTHNAQLVHAGVTRQQQQMLALMLFVPAHRRVKFVPRSGGSGDYSHLDPGDTATLPQASAYGPGMTFNPLTGDYDGSAVDSSFPVTTHTVTLTDLGSGVSNMANLNAAYDNFVATATSNWLITLPTGSEFWGRIFPKPNPTGFKCVTQWIGAPSLLPAMSPGTAPGNYFNRVTPAFRGQLPKILSTLPTVELMIARSLGTGTPTQGYYFRGLDFCNPNGNLHYWHLDISDVNETDVALHPKNIGFAQCLFDGGGTDNVTRAFKVVCEGFFVVDSYADNYGEPSDCQFVWGYGLGPARVHNCLSNIGHAAENVMTGGVPMLGTNAGEFVCHDWEISGNVFETKGEGTKANTEIKHGYRMFIGNNFCGYYGSGSPQEARFVIKVSDQYGHNTGVTTHDITIVNNLALDGPGFLTISGPEATDTTNIPHRIFAANNCAVGLDVGTGTPLRIGGNDNSDVNIIFNTLVTRQGGGDHRAISVNGYNSSRLLNNFAIRYNVLVGDDAQPDEIMYIESTNPGGWGEPGWALQATGASPFSNNFTNTTSSAKYGSQLRVANVAAMKFVDLPGKNARLRSDSPGYLTLDGKSYGCDFDLLDTLQARVKAA